MVRPLSKDANVGMDRTIVDAIPEPILLVGTDGSILQANHRFAQVFGYADISGIPDKLTDVFSDSVEFFRQSFRDWLGTSEPLPKMLHQTTPEAGETSFRVEGWRTKHGKGTALILRFFHDRTSVEQFGELTALVDNLNRECAARARIESELRKLLGQLNATNNMRDLIIAQMSHDLRTPLNAVLGMSDFILSEPFGPVESRYQDYVRDIKHSGEVLLELVDSVLSMTDDVDFLDRAKVLLVDLSDCLENCHRVVSPIAERRGISLLVPKNVRAPRIRAEKTLVKQILMNLIGNAAKHIHEGGHVKVDVDWQQGSDLNIRVIDDGPGIEPERLENLLRSNSRDAYATNKIGFGLGLYLTNQSAQAIGARIEIDSILGQGTTATMTFPAAMLDMSAL
jgi:signal transduction histidine kinase